MPEKLYQQALAHAQSCLPEEACGLVGGLGAEASCVIPISNQLHSPVRFRMDPAEQLRAFQKLDAESIELIAIYHSHPRGPLHPSDTDVREFAYPGVLTLIISPLGDGWQMRAFFIEKDQVIEELLDLVNDV